MDNAITDVAADMPIFLLGTLASLCAGLMVGFVVMMQLDVLLA